MGFLKQELIVLDVTHIPLGGVVLGGGKPQKLFMLNLKWQMLA